jgi:alkylhydroperoxidase/carboxymuconolactone decarboxylase family protein YurZ
MNEDAIERGKAMYHAVFGHESSDDLTGLREFTLEHLYADIWSRNAITLRERCIITVALLAAQGRDGELRQHLRAAVHQGLSKDELLEIMIHVAHYAGWPTGHSGQQAVLDVLGISAQELVGLNVKLAEAEKRGDPEAIAFLDGVLADDLIFRRANGEVVTKAKYLADLKPDAYDRLETTVETVTVHPDAAVVEVKVVAQRKGDEHAAEYKNIRRFVKRGGGWQLVAWLNTKIKDL